MKTLDYETPRNAADQSIVRQMLSFAFMSFFFGVIALRTGLISAVGCPDEGWSRFCSFEGWYGLVMILAGAVCLVTGIGLTLFMLRSRSGG